MNSALRRKSCCFIAGVLLAVIAVTQSFGQGRMLDGYIVSTQGDTVRGFIRYDGWGTSPMAVDFVKEKGGQIERVGADAAPQFFLTPLNEHYISKRIGVLNIDLSITYEIAPSFEAKDSVTVYLREITSGPKATLLEYLDLTERPHYFVEKDGKLTELLYYPFYRLIRGRKYLIQYDEYERQLPALLSDGADPGPVRGYSARDLGRYVDRYNGVSDKAVSKALSAESEMEIDFFVMGGVESWKEEEVNLKTKPTFGAGLRVNLPRRFHNRYFKILFSSQGSISETEIYGYTFGQNIKLNTLEVGAGTYMGSGNFRPNLGFEYSFGFKGWRSTILGPHAGISFRRQLSLEVSHFANFGSLFSDVGFFNQPRISLNYYLNLNKLFKSRK
ncbi:hypothetical protein SAMN04487996_106118 [Dyadobacter soli]|uniref:Uncharacterized protein n=1 Tax=Dyadobacter soli TaxID=659014 RepID=A0A1G7EMY1_9BACT|nr:hypothetical protein [Dyadobacter soli]SDE65060.1 hypothetical protein SAMN04487996_106118 [Dyadobacter soli]